MRILGIDPGLAALGYAIIDKQGNYFRSLVYGCFRTEAGLPVEQRLLSLYLDADRLFKEWQPRVMAVEQLFFNRNVTNAFLVGQARGVCLLAAAQNGCPVAEYTPLQVKQAVVGNGRAAKHQVGAMIRVLLNLPEIPRPDDAADALAVALCHGNMPPGFALRRG